MSLTGGQGSNDKGRDAHPGPGGSGNPESGPFHEIFQNAPVGIYQVTPEGRYLRANPAMARILGYESPAELLAAVEDVARQVYAESEAARKPIGPVVGRRQG